MSRGPGHRPQPGPGRRMVFSSSHRNQHCRGSFVLDPGDVGLESSRGWPASPSTPLLLGGPETILPLWAPGLELLTAPQVCTGLEPCLSYHS